MRYFKLVYDFENDDDYVIVKSSNKAEHYDSEIVKGELIENWDKDIKFEYNVEDGKILSDYLASDNGWVIVSKKFRDVVKEIVGENIQYLDINIINSKTKEEDLAAISPHGKFVFGPVQVGADGHISLPSKAA